MSDPDSGAVPRAVALSAGGADSAVVLHVPHASRTVPSWVRSQLALDDDELEVELDAITDTGADVVAAVGAAGAGVTPWVFASAVSRLVVDHERFDGPGEEMLAVGMGPVYTRTSTGRLLREPDPRQEQRVMREWYAPYAGAFGALVDDILTRHASVTILDVHTYSAEPLPYELHGDGPRPQVCLGVDPVHTPGWLLSAARRALGGSGRTVALNTPFAGAYVPSRHHLRDRRVSALMIELRRDPRTPGAAPALADTESLGGALAELVDRCPSGAALPQQQQGMR